MTQMRRRAATRTVMHDVARLLGVCVRSEANCSCCSCGQGASISNRAHCPHGLTKLRQIEWQRPIQAPIFI